jgi:hypothetical protein
MKESDPRCYPKRHLDPAGEGLCAKNIIKGKYRLFLGKEVGLFKLNSFG